MSVSNFKNDFFKCIENYDFLNNDNTNDTLLHHLNCTILKYIDSPNANILESLNHFKCAISQLAHYQNVHDRKWFFDEIKLSLTNLNDNCVWMDLISFFYNIDEKLIYELNQLTNHNALLTQKNLELENKLLISELQHK